ncbi:DivIVA domain-containing protein [Velocimicrobium porci]|uniref:DivIVA domain-containing protein n=1 Tax=Velocimicrobium porci TaxID=2606634 RepID=A0A6L5Y0M9_9FIRM|nr:DivIVA domain-containing protein [Velocimicrobium porci]MSS63968.1 DivIVA domain-containing protein [Velocimicrobium porci]
MLTPVEMQNRPLKTGRGYKKNEMDEFLEEVFKDYEQLYKENLELKDKLSVLSDGLQYYKDLEKTLQKTLVVAEKAAEETKNASISKANAIEQKAQAQARYIIEDAKKQAEKIHNQTVTLLQQYENYRSQYKQLVSAQLELMESDAFHLRLNNIADTPDFLKEEETKNADIKIPNINKSRAVEPEITSPEEEIKDEKSDDTIPVINIPDIDIPEVNIPKIEMPEMESTEMVRKAPDSADVEQKPIVVESTTHVEQSNNNTNISHSEQKNEDLTLNEIVKKELTENISSINSSSLEAFAPEKKPIRQEAKTELKRPDKIRITRPERLYIHKKITSSQETSVQEKNDNFDDTFEFL